MSDAPDYDSYLSSKVQHEVERLRTVNAALIAFAQRVADNEGPWSGQAEDVLKLARS